LRSDKDAPVEETTQRYTITVPMKTAVLISKLANDDHRKPAEFIKIVVLNHLESLGYPVWGDETEESET
jgi:hypothetical protein